MKRQLFAGIDIGGTFTDLVLTEAGKRSLNFKTLTTPTDPLQGVITALQEALSAIDALPETLQRVVHATTLATNLVFERSGAKVAFITTQGFGDLFEISKQKPVGADRFNTLYKRPDPFVKREMVVEVTERMNARGEVLVPLNEAEARRAIYSLSSKGPESVAVCLLNSYANPAHEQTLARLIRDELPQAYVSLSSDVWPEYLEYERASTTLISAYIGPMLSGYTHGLEQKLKDMGVEGALLIMQSSGGVMRAADAAHKAAYVIESGPAAGVIATAHLGRLCGYSNLISFDMGGTTAKAGVVQQGKPRITHNFRVGGSVSAGAKGAGEPVKIPVIDLAEVGAGGGSIAWVDAGGLIRVGPRSAGASPGPACYGLGGTEPTVTDANVILGYLDPEYFLGGRMKINAELSREAVGELARKTGIDVVSAAAGIYEIANANMGSTIRIVTLQRGIDPRDYPIAAFGGAGPIHIVRVAEQFDIRRIIIPPSPGVRSAFGLLVSDLTYDYVATAVMPLAKADVSHLNQLFGGLEKKARTDLARNVREIPILMERALGVRLVSQVLDLSVPIQDYPISDSTLAQAETDFRRAIFELSGLKSTDPCMVVNCLLRAVGVVQKADTVQTPLGDGRSDRALKKCRLAYFKEVFDFANAAVYDRSLLQNGDAIVGPAIIEEPDSTTVCPPGYSTVVDGYLNLVIERASL
jgi:N-methylhydantoinase A